MKRVRQFFPIAAISGVLLVFGLVAWNLTKQKRLATGSAAEPLSLMAHEHSETMDAAQGDQQVEAQSGPVIQKTGKGQKIIEHELSIIHNSPQLKRYRFLAKKVLTRAEDRVEIERLWSDAVALNDAKNALLREDSASLTEANQLTRIRVIDYLAKSAAWQENPKSEDLKNLLVGLVKQGPSTSSELARKIRGADRVELYYILKKNFPEAAQVLREHAAEYGLVKLIAYAEEHESQHNTVVAEH